MLVREPVQSPLQTAVQALLLEVLARIVADVGQIGLGGLLDRDQAAHFVARVVKGIHHDTPQPAAERVSPKAGQKAINPNKGVLKDVVRVTLRAAQSVGEVVHIVSLLLVHLIEIVLWNCPGPPLVLKRPTCG